MDSFSELYRSTVNACGTDIFAAPLGGRAVSLIPLDILGTYAEWVSTIKPSPMESERSHKTFTAVIGKPAVNKPLTLDEYFGLAPCCSGPDGKLGRSVDRIESTL